MAAPHLILIRNLDRDRQRTNGTPSGYHRPRGQDCGHLGLMRRFHGAARSFRTSTRARRPAVVELLAATIIITMPATIGVGLASPLSTQALPQNPPSLPIPAPVAGLRPVAGASMVYDSADHYVVLFGGENSTVPTLGATWIFKNGIWSQLHPLVSPPGRWGAMIAYDAVDGYVVLYGGANWTNNGTNILNDTWTFKGGTWTHLSLGSNPGHRVQAMMTYDGLISAVLLFGGANCSIGCGYTLATQKWWNDTWEFVHGKWAQVLTTKAPPLTSAADFSYDAATRQAVLFGGYEKVPSIKMPGHWTLRAVNSTWAFASGKWTLRHPPTSPYLLAYYPSAYDPKDRGVMLLANIGSSSVGTWEYEHTNWTRLSPNASPPERLWAAMTFDPAGPYMLLVGGVSLYPFAYMNDTWGFAAGNWTRL